MAKLTPWLDQKFYLADGITPNAGGKIFTYEAGTNTKKVTLKSESGSANTNPIICNSVGEVDLWFEAGSYKVVNAPANDTDPPTSAIKTWDDINASSSEGSQGVVDTLAELKGLDEGAFTTVQMLGYNAVGDQGAGLFRWDDSSTASDNGGTIIAPTVSDGTGRWFRVYDGQLNVAWWGTFGDGLTDDTAAITNALTFANANEGDLYFPDGSYKLISGITVALNTKLIMSTSASFTSGTPVTITINGEFQADLSLCFSGSVTVAFAVNSFVEKLPQWWGAVAKAAEDQGEDDTLAIQNCLDSGGGKVFIPAGIYMVDAVTVIGSNPRGGINIPSNIEIEMTDSTVLQILDNVSDSYSGMIAFEQENILIRGGTIRGDITRLDIGGHTGVAFSGIGLRIQGSFNVTVHDFTCSNNYADGFVIQYSDDSLLRECKNVRLINCTAFQNYRNGCSVIGCEVGSIEGGEYYDNGETSPKAGIDLEPNPNGVPTAWKVNDFVVDGAAVYENGAIGIEVFAPPGSPDANAERIQIVNCNIRDNVSQGIFIRYADYINIANNDIGGHGTLDQQTGIYVEHSEYVNVDNNTVHGHSGAGILVQNGSTVTTDNINVVGNNLFDNGAGINIDGVSGKVINFINISNNIVSTSGAYGIRGNFMFKSSITGNQLHGNLANAGITLGTCDDSNIANNIIDTNVGPGILISGGNYLTITGNTVKLSQQQGIKLGSANKCTVIGNTVYANSQQTDATYPNIELSGSSTFNIVAQNVIRDGGLANQPNYGVHIVAVGDTNNLVKDNQMDDSGKTANFLDAGVDTVFVGYQNTAVGFNTDDPLDLTGSTFNVDIAGELNVGKNINASMRSSTFNNTRYGLISTTPVDGAGASNGASDSFIGANASGGPGDSIGDLLFIGKSNASAKIIHFTGTPTTSRAHTIDETQNTIIKDGVKGASAVGALVLGNGTKPSAGGANSVNLYSLDLSAGNTMLGMYTEGTPVGGGTPTADKTIAIEVNGTTYYLLASTTP